MAKTVVTMNTVQIFGTIDPAKISDYTDYMAAVNLYDGLVTVDSAGNIIPELAESWTVSDDAKEVDLQDPRRTPRSPTARRSRPATWSIPSSACCASTRARRTCSPACLTPGSVTAVDDKTVKFTLSKTFAPFLTTVPAILILNAERGEGQRGHG